MKFNFHILAALVFAVAMAAGADTAKKTTAAGTKKTASRIPVKISKTTSRVPANAASKGKSNVRTAARSVPARQSGPTSDRYKEIQESLIAKGYLQGTATGAWDQNSIDAMKKYQTDQKQDPTGKITAKALITLGLGPKDESTSTANK